MNHYEEKSIAIIQQNKVLMDILSYLEEMQLPQCYVAAGCVFQTIWNYLDGNDLMYHIKDIDVIYFDEDCLQASRDDRIENELNEYFHERGYDLLFDVHNEARMHLWKQAHEHKEIEPYSSSENAMSRWITSVHAIGVRKEKDRIIVCAPCGLEDIFTKTIRPIKHCDNSEALYLMKVKTWQKRFRNLNVITWESDSE